MLNSMVTDFITPNKESGKYLVYDFDMKKIIIYSTPNCHFCNSAKELFKENNLEYEEINVAENPDKRKEMIDMTGQMGVPVIRIENDVYVGFDEVGIKEKLGIA